jgi:effector-binding domain-containing protein
MEVRLERLKTIRAAYIHSSSDTPEEDAEKRIIEWAKSKGLMEKNIGARLFGRNTYPTDKPEPHGYELYLTVENDFEYGGDIEMREIPGGLYVVLRFTNLNKIREAWDKLWKWFEESEYKPADWKKSEHGWVDGFEEQVDWQEEKPQTEWIFDLWVQIKE